MDESDYWFIIHCSKDDSHSLVRSSDVICDESVKKGDTVRFSYSGRLYSGLVKDFGDDHDMLKRKLKELNAQLKSKRGSSFDADKPRKAATKCKNEMKRSIETKKKSSKSHSFRDGKPTDTQCDTQRDVTQKLASSSCSKDETIHHKISNISSSNKPSTSGKVEMKQLFGNDDAASSDDEPLMKMKKEAKLKVVDVYSSDTENNSSVEVTDRNDSQSSDEDELTEAEIKLLEKLAKKKKIKDLKLLSVASEQASKPAPVRNVRDVTDDLVDRNNTADSVICEQQKKMVGKELSNFSHLQSMMPESPGSSTLLKMKVLSKKQKCSPIPKAPDFKGEFFRNKEDDIEVEELSENSKIYLKTSEMKKMRKKAKTATAVARMLLKAIFSDDAILSCSVSGRPSCGKGSKETQVRPSLHEDTVNAIIDYSKKRAEKKKWPVPLESAIRSSLGSLLCEERAKNRALEEESDEAAGA